MAAIDLNEPIDVLLISISAGMRLRNGKVFTIRDLVQSTSRELVKRTRVSRSHFDEIVEDLASYGLSLGMTIDSSGTLLSARDPSETGFPPENPPDPAKYVHFYRNNMYSFLPQSLMDDFYSIISHQLNQRVESHTTEVAEITKERESGPGTPDQARDPYSLWKDLCYEEGQIRDQLELLQLADELMFLGL